MTSASTASCRFCGAPLQHFFADLGMSPLANSYLKPSELNRMEPFYPLQVYVCGECFLVQAGMYETPDHIFSDYAYFSSFSDAWLQHAKTYTDMITERLGLSEKSQVIEIASNDGYLLQYFVKRGIPALGIEPAANVAEAAVKIGIPTLVAFFGPETARRLAEQGKQADLLIGNNVLAHVPDINEFVTGLKLALKPGGVITMEFPHLMRLMEENQFDTIYHEHFSYFSFLAVEKIFAKHGLTLFDVEELPTHGGSLRIYGCHAGRYARGERAQDLLKREAAAGLDRIETYLRFQERIKETKRKVLEFLVGAKRSGKTIAGYGAPAKGNTLLNYCGVRSDFIDYTVDRSPHKQGLYLPGTHIPILAPDEIRRTKPDYLFVLPWNLIDEIVEQMAEIRTWGGQFVVPIPEVRIIK
jgi:SAM-dependent methyltransferase